MTGFTPESKEWSDDEIEQLKTLCATGVSSAVIASTLKRTRSSVIGKCHRLKIPLGSYANGGQSAKNTRAVAQAASVRRRKPIVTLSAAQTAPESAPERVVVENVVSVEIEDEEPPAIATAAPALEITESERVTLFDLRESSCRFPLWHDSARPPIEQRFYCGARIDPAQSYCDHHAQRCYVPFPIHRKPYMPSRGHA